MEGWNKYNDSDTEIHAGKSAQIVEKKNDED
jgi:hypothetical protein